MTEIDESLLAEVMAQCRAELPELPDYIVYVNSVDMMMRNMGIDNTEQGNELYKIAKKEMETTTYNIQVI